MARFLFVVPPLAGHVNPTVAVGRALSDAGHVVAWVGCASKIQPLLEDSSVLFPIDESGISSLSDNWMEKSQRVFGLESFKFFYEEFLVPLGHAMVDDVEIAVEQFKPDLIICDQQALAGGIIARQAKIPWVTMATTPVAVFNPLGQFPKVKEWMDEKLGQFQDVYKLDRWERPDISQKQVIIFTIPELVGEQSNMPSHYEFVGPAIRMEKTQLNFPWEKLANNNKKIYLSLGTVNAERSIKFYEKVKEAFAEKDLQMILSAPPEMLGKIPSNFIVQKNIPQLELLKHVDAVVFHGGQNTLSESLLNGLPLVVAPIKDDQSVIAQQVTRCGVGLRVHFDRVKSGDLFQSVQRVLHEPQFALAARELQKHLMKSGGAQRAAELIVASLK